MSSPGKSLSVGELLWALRGKPLLKRSCFCADPFCKVGRLPVVHYRVKKIQRVNRGALTVQTRRTVRTINARQLAVKTKRTVHDGDRGVTVAECRLDGGQEESDDG